MVEQFYTLNKNDGIEIPKHFPTDLTSTCNV